MMRIALRVGYVDGSEAQVTTSASDLLEFERHFDKPISVFGTDVRIEYMLYLTWTSLHRQKKTKLEFDKWVDTVNEIVFGDEDTDIVPLESTPATG